MKKYLKNEKGITLVALVVTIIVLLILAGVTITTLTGENGILAKGSSAKLNTEQASILEQLRLEIYEKTLDKEGNKNYIEYLQAKGIIQEDTSVGIIGKYASITEIAKLDSKKVASINAKTRDKRYVVNVDKLLANASTGKGSYALGDVYYILNGDLYYRSEIKENKIVGTVFSVAKANISYFNYRTTDDEAYIIGFNLANIPYKNTGETVYSGNPLYVFLMEELVIPSEIDGKPVTQVSFDDSIGGDVTDIGVGGVKEISYPNTLKILSGENTIFQDLETIFLPEGLEKITGKVFYFSDKVKQLTIPATVNTIEGKPFLGWNSNAIINVVGKASESDFENCDSTVWYFSDMGDTITVNFLGK